MNALRERFSLTLELWWFNCTQHRGAVYRRNRNHYLWHCSLFRVVTAGCWLHETYVRDGGPTRQCTVQNYACVVNWSKWVKIKEAASAVGFPERVWPLSKTCDYFPFPCEFLFLAAAANARIASGACFILQRYSSGSIGVHA